MIQGSYLREILFSTSGMAQLVLRMLPSFYLNDREMGLQLIERDAFKCSSCMD